MADRNRRVICKTADLDSSMRAQLAEKLSDAIDWQQTLAARSPHVLQFTSGLQETDDTYWVEHEDAASKFADEPLFDGTPPPVASDPVLQLTAALMNALAVAHAGKRNEFRAHGCVCPGVVLTTPDGIDKLTDFGFAMAISQSLGPEAYLNLAVGCGEAVTAIDAAATARWEVLSADEFDREDRICAFIDPEKFGNAAHATFEPGSDVISAAFVIHLMAEHQHPYLLEPDAHRLVEMSEMMAMYRYNGARRQELLDSDDPAIRAWCELLEKMLARVSINRPSAKEAADALGNHVKSIDKTELLRRRVAAAEELAEKKDWDRLRAALVGVVEADEVPEDVAARARNLFETADAYTRLSEAQAHADDRRWIEAQANLDRIRDPAVLPADDARKFEALRELLAKTADATARAQKIRDKLKAIPKLETAAQVQALRDHAGSVDSIVGDESLPEAFRDDIGALRDELEIALTNAESRLAAEDAARREEEERLERQRQADRETAQAWLTDVQSTVSEKEPTEEDWDALKRKLSERPDITSWPDEVTRRVTELEQSLAAALQRRAEAAQRAADEEAAAAWLQSIEELSGKAEWEALRQAFASRPNLTFFPDEKLEAARKLDEQAASEITRAADASRAAEYVARLKAAVDQASWEKAGEVLAQRPALTYWSDEILETEQQLRHQVEEHFEAVEFQKQQLDAWIDAASKALADEKWDDVIRLADTPPIERRQIPHEAGERIERLRKDAEKGRTAARERTHKRMAQGVRKAFERWLDEHLSQRFKPYLVRADVSAEVSDLLFDMDRLQEGGKATVSLACPQRHEGVRIPLVFSVDQDGALSIDDVSGTVDPYLETRVADLQKQGLDAIPDLLEKGPFPHARLISIDDTIAPGVPIRRLKCGISLESETDAIPVTLEWSARELKFELAGRDRLIEEMGRKAAESITTKITPVLVQRLEALQPYQALLECEVQPGKFSPGTGLPERIPLESKVSLKLPGGGQSRFLGRIEIDCRRAGEVPADVDVSKVGDAFTEFMLETQRRALDRLVGEANEKAKAVDEKLKAWHEPLKLEAPASEINVVFGRKKKKELAYAELAWSPEAFSFSWRVTPDSVLSGTAAPEETPKTGSSLAKILPIAAVVIAAAGIGGYVFLSGQQPEPDGGGTPAVTANSGTQSGNSGQPSGVSGAGDQPPGDNSTTNAGDTPGGPDDATLDIEQVQSDARGILREGSRERLDPYAMNLVTVVQEDGTPPRIQGRVPGLADDTFDFPLVAGDLRWQLSAEHEEELRTRASELYTLLSIDDAALAETAALVQAGLRNSEIAAMLEPESLRIVMQPGQSLTWDWIDDQNRWLARQVTVQVAGGEPIILEGIRTEWEVADGTRALLPQGADGDREAVTSHILNLLQDAIVQRQRDSASILTQDIVRRVGNEEYVVLAESDAFPRATIAWNIQWPGLLPRELTASWNRELLVYRPSGSIAFDWEELIERWSQAADTVKLINGQGNWMSDATTAAWRESTVLEDDGRWALAAAAPWWSGDTESPPEATMVVHVPADSLKGDALNWMSGVLDFKPAYWPALETVAALRGEAFPAAQSPYREQLLTELGLPQDALQFCSVKMNWLGVSIVSPEDAEPAIEIQYKGTWSVARVPESIKLDRVQEYVSQTTNEAMAVVLRLRADDSGNISPTWRLDPGFADDLDKVRELDRLLLDRPDRLALEKQIKDRGLANGNVLSEADAVTLLGSIWDIKGVVGKPSENSWPNLAAYLAERHLGFSNASVLPTVLVEYFCGPDQTYALCFSVDGAYSVVDGPYLLSLYDTRDLVGRNMTPTIQPTIGRVLDSFGKDSPTLTAAGTGNILGIVLAPDDPMGFIVPQLASTPLAESYTSDLKRDVMSLARPVNWSSLQELRDAGRLGDFQVVGHLAKPEEWSPSTSSATPWAYDALD